MPDSPILHVSGEWYDVWAIADETESGGRERRLDSGTIPEGSERSALGIGDLNGVAAYLRARLPESSARKWTQVYAKSVNRNLDVADLIEEMITALDRKDKR